MKGILFDPFLLSRKYLIDFDLNKFYCPFIGAETPLKKRRYIH